MNAETDETAEAPSALAGERGPTILSRARSLQSRISNILAIGLMSALGLGLLGWYYAHTFSAQSGAKKTAQAASKAKAAGDLPLPSLGPIEAPPTAAGKILGPAPEEPPPEDIPNAWLEPARDATPPVHTTAQPPVKSAEELALERRLSGPVATSVSLVASAAGASTPNPDPLDSQSTNTGLAAVLHPTATPAVQARALATHRLLLPKGAFIDCTLETAIDSTLPGMVTCITATDTFGVDGSTVLIERGSKLVGETRGEVRQGSARVFVLWTQARTPAGIVVPLDSPGTDELGRSGLPGHVNRHFVERFGAALLVSVIDGVIQSETQRRSDAGTVILNPSASQDVMTEVLKSTINIAPTVVKHQGDRIQILVARDIDFRSVYELRATRR